MKWRYVSIFGLVVGFKEMIRESVCYTTACVYKCKVLVFWNDWILVGVGSDVILPRLCTWYVYMYTIRDKCFLSSRSSISHLSSPHYIHRCNQLSCQEQSSSRTKATLLYPRANYEYQKRWFSFHRLPIYYWPGDLLWSKELVLCHPINHGLYTWVSQ